MASKLHVQTGEAGYDVIIRPGLLDAVGEHVRRHSQARSCAVVVDRNVGKLYGNRLRRSLEAAGFSLRVHDIPAGEESKSLDMLSATYDGFLALPLERSTPVIALGGGMTTDLAGFAAATLLRGLPFIPIPTSLLAMVDASVGGKTGINHAAGKNLIGAFHQPAAVLIDPEVLATLPPRELKSGLAEVIKHYIIRDAAGFERLERRLPAVLQGDPAVLAEVIAENVAIKAAIVEQDPFERNIRAHLNFGHTFGHAYEKASDYRLAHGEAVALGMCSAMHAAEALGMVEAATKDRVVRLIEAAGLPVKTDLVDPAAALSAMRADKKIEAGRLRFILPERLGSVVIRDDVPAEVVGAAVQHICV